jgi:exodeoxyribonuclease-5
MLKVLAWKDYFKFVSKFNKVAYIYAMTVHRAQGSTFETVYAINNDFDILQWDHVERNQLKYVAFTRPSKKLVIYTPN